MNNVMEKKSWNWSFFFFYSRNLFIQLQSAFLMQAHLINIVNHLNFTVTKSIDKV